MVVVHAGVDHRHDDVAVAAGRQALVAQPRPRLGTLSRPGAIAGVERVGETEEAGKKNWLFLSPPLLPLLPLRPSAPPLSHRFPQIVRLGPGDAGQLGEALGHGVDVSGQRQPRAACCQRVRSGRGKASPSGVIAAAPAAGGRAFGKDRLQAQARPGLRGRCSAQRRLVSVLACAPR